MLTVEHNDPPVGEPVVTEPPAAYLRVEVVGGVAHLELIPLSEAGVEQPVAADIAVSAVSLKLALHALITDVDYGEPDEWQARMRAAKAASEDDHASRGQPHDHAAPGGDPASAAVRRPAQKPPVAAR
jgi:hypothetical protein